ncbi:MAG: hypothetical protein U0271_13180 [Polyangiaceae bacterium]
MTNALDWMDLDRRVRGTADALALWETTPDTSASDALGEPAPCPIPRAVSNRELLESLRSLSIDPLAKGLAAWVAHLTLERVTWADAERVRSARLASQTLGDGASASVEELARSLLGPSTNRELVGRRLVDASAAMREPLARYMERRREARRLLGLATPPIADLVEDWLKATDAAFEAHGHDAGWSEAIVASLGSEVGEGWPAHLTWRWVRETLGDRYFEGARPVALGAAPAPLGAMSFARALASAGSECARIDRASSVPFVLAREPADALVRARHGLFGALVLTPTFHQRKLGLGRERARRQAAAAARAALVASRWAAISAVSHDLLAGAHGRRDFEDFTARALGRGLPGSLLGVLPRHREDAPARFTGWVEGLLDARAMRDRFDEDWFDNPRAIEALRAEHHLAISARASRAPKTVLEACSSAARSLTDLLEAR